VKYQDLTIAVEVQTVSERAVVLRYTYITYLLMQSSRLPEILFYPASETSSS